MRVSCIGQIQRRFDVQIAVSAACCIGETLQGDVGALHEGDRQLATALHAVAEQVNGSLGSLRTRRALGVAHGVLEPERVVVLKAKRKLAMVRPMALGAQVLEEIAVAVAAVALTRALVGVDDRAAYGESITCASEGVRSKRTSRCSRTGSCSRRG